MRVWALFGLMSTLTSTVMTSKSLESNGVTPRPVKILSRQRRFFIPQTSGWNFRITFAVSFPLEGFGPTGPLGIQLPVTYNVDSGK